MGGVWARADFRLRGWALGPAWLGVPLMGGVGGEVGVENAEDFVLLAAGLAPDGFVQFFPELCVS